MATTVCITKEEYLRHCIWFNASAYTLKVFLKILPVLTTIGYDPLYRFSINVQISFSFILLSIYN